MKFKLFEKKVISNSNPKKSVAEKSNAKKTTSKTPVKISAKLPIKTSIKPTLTMVKSKNDIMNLLELINIRKIIREVLQEELAQLKINPIYSSTSGPSVLEKRKSKLVNKNNDVIYEDDPMDIDLVRKDEENSKDLLAVKGDVNGINIQTLADTCANISFLRTEDCEELGIEVDTSKRRKISGASGEGETVGIARNVSVRLAAGCIIKDNFAVISGYKHREIALSRNCLKHYNYFVDESREHIGFTCKGKNFFIPIVPDENRRKV